MKDAMTAEAVRSEGERLGVRSNWGRWGDDDQRGTLNLITAEVVMRAAAAVRAGLTFALGRPLDITHPPYYPKGDGPPFYPQGLDAAVKHEMITAWSSNAGGDVQAASDQLHIQCHGLDTTHMDALCHIGYGGIGYNGRAFSEMVDLADGASVCDMLAAGPVATRGVLVDVPRARGIDFVEPGEPITADDLRPAAEHMQPGDALVIRTGRARSGPEGRTATNKYGRITGLHHGAMGLIGDLDVSLLAMDGSADNFPAVDDVRLPIHTLALVHLGVHLVHNLALEGLADYLAAKDRHDFLFIAAPLGLPRGTGSPLNPVGVV
jgi:kynurenine formamidase